MRSNQILQGEALAMLRTLPSEYVQACITSPPYLGLRDYGVPGQIGLESTVEAYIAKLVEVFREVRRVLRHDGVLWLNLGDGYAGSGKGGQSEEKRSENWQPDYTNKGAVYPGYKPKDLLMIPARVALALQADGWWLRADCIWHKPNCMPESVEDRPTKSHEYLFLLSKSERYYYDAQAIAEPAIHTGRIVRASLPGAKNEASRGIGDAPNGAMRTSWGFTQHDTIVSSLRNKRSVWIVASQPYPESHFATFPPKLIEPCILAGSRPGDSVLDPFLGAGTTALVALQHHRAYLGIELNPEYVVLARRRIACIQPNMWESEASA